MPKDTREPQEILAHVSAAGVALTCAIYGLSEAELTMAGAVGRWSVKDVMAHLGRWEEICLAEVQKHLRGEQSTEDYRDALPYNDRWEAELHMLSLQEAIGLFETAHYRLFGLLWYHRLPTLRNKPGQRSCSPPWISQASPRSFRIRAGYLTRLCPTEHTGWNVLLWTNDSPTTLRVCASAYG